MKILWFTNIRISEENFNSSGTWIVSMLEYLIKYPDLEFLIVCEGDTRIPIRVDYKNIEQWVFPYEKNTICVNRSKKNISFVSEIINTFKPDLIHIWGVEKRWGIVVNNIKPSCKVLLEIQGFKGLCSKVLYGGLIFSDFIFNIGLADLRYPKMFIPIQKNEFRKWGKIEKEIIKNTLAINTQSEWVREYIRTINKKAIIYKTGIILRREIIESSSWLEKRIDNNQLFTIASEMPYKGVHITLLSFAELKKKQKNLTLKIAGIKINEYYKNYSYVNYLYRLCKALNISDSVVFLGNITADKIIEEIYKSSVFIISSYIETFSLALAEALHLGIPCVSSNAGALTELGKHGKSVLYYEVGDYIACAASIYDILSDSNLSVDLSINARQDSIRRNDTKKIVENQIDIYKKLLEL